MTARPFGNLPLSKWLVAFFGIYGGSQALLAVLFGIALNVSARNILLVWLLVLWSGGVGLALVYWARQTGGTAGAWRFSAALFVLCSLYYGSILLVAARAGLMSRSSAVSYYGEATIVLAIMGVWLALRAVRRAKANKEG